MDHINVQVSSPRVIHALYSPSLEEERGRGESEGGGGGERSHSS